MVAEEKDAKIDLDVYVCPECRILFSAHLSQEGACVPCPGCNALVVLPYKGKAKESLRLRRTKKYIKEANSSKVSLDNEGEAQEEWEKSGNSNKLEPQELPWVWIVPASVIGLGLVVAMLMMVLKQKPVKAVEINVIEADRPVDVVVSDVERVREENVYDESKHEELLEESIQSFLAVESVEELLLYARPVEGIEAKMRNFYKDRPFIKKKYRKLVNRAKILEDDSLVAFRFEYDDYSFQSGVAQLVEGKILIDWEVFVIYSEMPWDKFVKEKPTTGVEMRVRATLGNYYNFGFNDKEWVVFEITSPVEERLLYAYVRKNSSEEIQLRKLGGREELGGFVLKVKYPENAKSDNQVLVESILKADWKARPLSIPKK